jgi:hypothetical protein
MEFNLRTIIIIIVIILGVLGVFKFAHNVSVKNKPPIACELFGGNWNIFDGWSCNG